MKWPSWKEADIRLRNRRIPWESLAAKWGIRNIRISAPAKVNFSISPFHFAHDIHMPWFSWRIVFLASARDFRYEGSSRNCTEVQLPVWRSTCGTSDILWKSARRRATERTSAFPHSGRPRSSLLIRARPNLRVVAIERLRAPGCVAESISIRPNAYFRCQSINVLEVAVHPEVTLLYPRAEQYPDGNPLAASKEEKGRRGEWEAARKMQGEEGGRRGQEKEKERQRAREEPR